MQKKSDRYTCFDMQALNDGGLCCFFTNKFAEFSNVEGSLSPRSPMGAAPYTQVRGSDGETPSRS